MTKTEFKHKMLRLYGHNNETYDVLVDVAGRLVAAGFREAQTELHRMVRDWGWIKNGGCKGAIVEFADRVFSADSDHKIMPKGEEFVMPKPAKIEYDELIF